MRNEARRIHLLQLRNKLRIAEFHVTQGKEFVEQQRERAHRLRKVSGQDTVPTLNADTLLRMLEDTQGLFEVHVDLIKREIATET